mmetsp:Transcript_42240/g.64755  ORF Transcript_42240/g.64755 Transcript_42240/m.64755 type:complete len:108 (+) Transcript_42240:521-844(+)
MRMKTYPLFIGFLFFLILRLNIPVLLGILIGYRYCEGGMKWLHNSRTNIAKWERRWPYTTLKTGLTFQEPKGFAVSGGGQRENGEGGGFSIFGGGAQSGTNTTNRDT